LEEVGEVILVEDGSPDQALGICMQLAEIYPKVKLLQHPGGENRGPGASRNLGILNAQFEYIAFLDADDWYLPHRFIRDMEVFNSYPDADGVYGATGFYFQENGVLDPDKLTTFHKELAPEQVALSLLTGEVGGFHTDSFTVKKDILNKVGLFDEELMLHQDSHLWIRLAILGNLYPSDIKKAIAIRRVHKRNRIIFKNSESRKLFNKKLFLSLSKIDKIDPIIFRLAFRKYVNKKSKNLLGYSYLAFLEILKKPSIIFKCF